MARGFATDHLALVTGSTAATVDFYTRVMGWPLVGAHRGTEPDGSRFLITAFQGDGWRLEFEEVDGRPGPAPQAPGFPHLGVDVGSEAAYEDWKAHLDGCGVAYLELAEHDCFFADPNGLCFQLFVAGTPSFAAHDPDAAGRLVQEWLGEHPG